MLNWNNWTTELMVVAAIAALVHVHVVEEWVFPGGSHYQCNTLLYKSEHPDHYPMCLLTDMITNLEATVGYISAPRNPKRKEVTDTVFHCSH